MWPFDQIKSAIVQHEVKTVMTDTINNQSSLSPQTKAWLISIVVSTIGAAAVGGVTVMTHGTINWGATLVAYFFLVIHTMVRIPMPREVWTDAQRLAQQRIDAIDLAHQKAVADAKTAKDLADAAAAKATVIAQSVKDEADAKAKTDGKP